MRTIDYAKEPQAITELVKKRASRERDVEQEVRTILYRVRDGGDRAVLDYTLQFDCSRIEEIGIRVSSTEIRRAYKSVSTGFLRALRTARRNIGAFHARQIPRSFSIRQGGLRTGLRYAALARVGMYIPGGKASYPSTVLMNGIPAVIAGVPEIVMVTPCDEAGRIAPEVLVAAGEVGVSELYRIGGAQAIAALAYGTETVGRVDKITGPGNLYVATAKRLVYGRVGIDSLAGPTEVLIIADDQAPVDYVAADLIAQAEHDEHALAICVGVSVRQLERIANAVDRQLQSAPRRMIAEAALNRNGLLILVKSVSQAVNIANILAPEHCELLVKDPRSVASKITKAGALFVGKWATEALGDYIAGPNHTLPTAGTARYSSALGTLDFMRYSTVLECTRRSFMKLAPEVEILAEAEGLHGHAASVRIRREQP